MSILDDLFGGEVPTPPQPPVAAPVAPKPLAKLQAATQCAAPGLGASRAEDWANVLQPRMQATGIVTGNRIAAFLGQVAVESQFFQALQENLNYTAPRLCAVWPAHFPKMPDLVAQRCAGNPPMIANLVYANRMGNGDEASGDGYAFRGRGLIQLTGRDAYARFAASVKMDIEAVAPWASTPQGAAASACWFWSSPQHRPSLNALADAWSITAITKAVNGGDEGLATRIQVSERVRKLFA